jgi:predicted unusual protein kinase regulating ubiquinone biosynthesis (AarF/ABC1/UbiB family)
MSAAPGLSVSERLQRARRIGTTFGRIYLGIKANQFVEQRLRPRDMRKRWSRFNRESAESIYEAAVELRGLILKGCQFMGSRADVLPREYVQVLSALQDRVPAKSMRVVRRTVEHSLGQSLEDVFSSFSTEPIASASLAQVHEARLQDGRRVAVKVQYPEIAALVRSDLSNLRLLFRAVGIVERDVDLMPLVEELGTHVPLELDFVNESRNAELARELFGHRDDVVIPAIHSEWTRRRVLVMDYVEGIKITDVAALRRAGVDTSRVAEILVDVYCEQILTHGWFHADPHPGNLLVDPEGPRLVLLDFGLAKRLPPGFRKSVMEFGAALLQEDPEQMATSFLDLGFETRDGSSESLVEIAQTLLEASREMREHPSHGRDVVEHLREELPAMIRANPVVRIPSHVVLLGRVLGLLSGTGHALGARIDLVRTILPYVLTPATQRPPAGS